MCRLDHEEIKLWIAPGLAHGGNPVTGWMATNVAVAQTPQREGLICRMRLPGA
jgi:hypothetical protein